MSENAAAEALFSADDLTGLRAAVAGPVLQPMDAAYAAECATYNIAQPTAPALTVGATSAEDVAHAVRFAARHGMAVAVKNAGHQVVPSVGADTLLITTSRMGGIDVDTAARTICVGAGVRWQEALDAAAKAGLAPLAGSAPVVGVTGYTLGGGLSPLLGRSQGYAADHVRWLEVVTADGTIRTVTPTDETELYWALLGGKGNFGIVTRVEFDAIELSGFYGGGLWFPGQDMVKVLEVWRTWAPTLPEEATTSFAVQRLPQDPALPEPLRGAFVLHVRFSHLGEAAEAERLLAPLRAAGTPVLDSLAARPVQEIGAIHVDPVDPLPYVEAGFGLREFSAETLAALVDVTGPDSDCPLVTVEVRALGGALDREPAVPNAVPSRGLPFVSFAFGVSAPPELPAMQAYLTRYAAALAPWADERNVVNFVAPDAADEEADVERVFGTERYRRLAEVKRQYDLHNVFRRNHNIRPAAAPVAQ
ncbi:FAD-binding oxidoreductase [Streptomyces sp. S.PB5]|uniref:FAD-binding oxidoreductase n=1 Tax=Streptomyces sp. S.PB5 TaxID=3020844 RepID=UPI0025AFD94F|nr:FAD-binding oxidoreductase [Streptomyces sp. S.PB5]MDN3027040.1 FAD-binding oxidoreductase [Streptomyces sp. S.PB5]